jgi:hypothetical protein
MTIETERLTFRGVVCLHCTAPIHVPPIVGGADAATDEGSELSQRKSKVFNIRCPVCHKEKPYRTSEIVEFRETPETAAPGALSDSTR